MQVPSNMQVESPQFDDRISIITRVVNGPGSGRTYLDLSPCAIRIEKSRSGSNTDPNLRSKPA